MDKEGFKETLARHFTEELHQLQHECQHAHSFDKEKFISSVKQMRMGAIQQGLDENEFHAILRDVAPDYVDEIEQP